MDEPAVVEEGAKKGLPKVLAAPKDGLKKTAAAWRSYPSLWAAVVVLLIGVIGQVLIYCVPPYGYLYGDTATYGHYQLVNSLNTVAQALTYLGAVWLGALLAYWAISRKKS
jgi:hypothetical protein